MRAKPIFTYSLIAGALALPGPAFALGLGKLTVDSALGQPLSARIELTSVSKDDLDSLRAKVADPNLYRQNNLTYQSTLSRTRISLENTGGVPYLKVTSPVSVQEPFLDLLVELDWASGRVVREYTFLLDPPGMGTPTAATAPITTPRAATPAITRAADDGRDAGAGDGQPGRHWRRSRRRKIHGASRRHAARHRRSSSSRTRRRSTRCSTRCSAATRPRSTATT